uniref:NADH-ubiquinone oxidoreductase chain 3 n=1 Tax=Meru phyllisae TaxID=535381 RepID=S4SV20_9COLE|nr:NADH dehydrogenase subunit 3 [Meru phyllisae]
MIIVSMMIIIFFLSLIIMMIANFISKKTFYDREKNSPFECGFDPMNSSRLPFSIHFFMIAIIFLIFDVEITLLLPMIKIVNYSSFYSWMLTFFLFIIILILGLYHEWNNGALKWSN